MPPSLRHRKNFLETEKWDFFWVLLLLHCAEGLGMGISMGLKAFCGEFWGIRCSGALGETFLMLWRLTEGPISSKNAWESVSALVAWKRQFWRKKNLKKIFFVKKFACGPLWRFFLWKFEKFSKKNLLERNSTENWNFQHFYPLSYTREAQLPAVSSSQSRVVLKNCFSTASLKLCPPSPTLWYHFNYDWCCNRSRIFSSFDFLMWVDGNFLFAAPQKIVLIDG